MILTLEQLRVFVAVAEREHVTEAARAINLTQSAVSNAVAALERRHEVRLFDRVGRNIVLNAVGRLFLGEARAVLARAAAAEAVLTDLGQLRRGRLSIFASQTIASYWLPKRLVAFHLAHPKIELEVSVGNTLEVAQAVQEGYAELGLVEGEVDAPALEAFIVGADQLVILVPPGHPWTRKPRVSPSDLIAAPWVTREPGSGTRSSLEAALRQSGVDPEARTVVLTLPSNEAVLAAVEAGAGVAALSANVAKAALEAKRLAQAPFALPSRPFRLLRHAERFRTRAADAFIDGLA
jgi:DNA-binding transcriptional LysR family regulator